LQVFLIEDRCVEPDYWTLVNWKGKTQDPRIMSQQQNHGVTL